MLNTLDLSEEQIAAIQAALEEERVQMQALRAKTRAAIEEVLTEEQLAQLQQNEQQMGGQGRPRGGMNNDNRPDTMDDEDDATDDANTGRRMNNGPRNGPPGGDGGGGPRGGR
jgi:hypothetical protein